MAFAVDVHMQNLLDDRRLLLPLILTAIAIAIGSVLIIVLTGDAASGESASTDSAPVAAQEAGAAVKVDITNFKYKPETITVKAGSKVTWVNNDVAPHTATADDAFDTGNLEKGDSKAVTLSKPGSYSYVCEFHAFMTGTVVVK